MKNIYISIGIKNSSLENVENILKSVVIDDLLEESINSYNLKMNVMDLREEYASMSKFLKENNLEDDTPFFNDFEIDLYGLRIDFDIYKNFKDVDQLEPVVFRLGRKLSFLLKTECIVMLDNNTVPAGLFDNGILIELFEKYNSDFFKNRSWRPAR